MEPFKIEVFFSPFILVLFFLNFKHHNTHSEIWQIQQHEQ